MINFDKGIEIPNEYLGAEKKMTYVYENEIYMIKLPAPNRGKMSFSYKNNQYSEHISCLIFKSCGFSTQETVLGTLTMNTGKVKEVVGCKIFTTGSKVLYEFSKFGNAVISESNMSNSIEDVNLIIDNSKFITEKESIKNRFWDMFVIDTLIANPDRHLNNWGLLRNGSEFEFSPIYDCGSSLGAIRTDEGMKRLLEEPLEFKNQEFNIKSCYRLNGKIIFCHQLFKNPPKELSEATKRTFPRIDMNAIFGIIDSVEQISEIRKEYLKRAIELRYEQMIKPAFKRIMRG